MASRPNNEDREVLELLMADENLDVASAVFIEEQWRRQDEGTWNHMTAKQWAWFDRLAERWL